MAPSVGKNRGHTVLLTSGLCLVTIKGKHAELFGYNSRESAPSAKLTDVIQKVNNMKQDDDSGSNHLIETHFIASPDKIGIIDRSPFFHRSILIGLKIYIFCLSWPKPHPSPSKSVLWFLNNPADKQTRPTLSEARSSAKPQQSPHETTFKFSWAAFLWRTFFFIQIQK